MFTTSLKWKLDPDAIRGTPRTQGVYGLWDGAELVYIGTTARDWLLPQALGELLALHQRGVIRATHVTWEITLTPRSWAGELLRLHFNRHGTLPRYNLAGGPLRHELQVDARPA
jgi:hypothetical protein